MKNTNKLRNANSNKFFTNVLLYLPKTSKLASSKFSWTNENGTKVLNI